jgi:L-2-hydroxyglutarate oxidase
MSTPQYDIAVIGGGIVGLATAMAITRTASATLIVLEAEDRVAAHQTGHNSGVIHSGLYYKPGSLKARNCVEGRQEMYRFCEEHGIAHERCGKVVVATSAAEVPALDELERRGQANGLQGLRRLGPQELREREPHVAGVAGLLVPETGIVDYTQVAQSYARLVAQAGGAVQTGSRVGRVVGQACGFVLQTSTGEIGCRSLINCAGLQSDRVARLCGLDPGLQIVPFRGEYYKLTPARQGLVRQLIYPVPDPAFPFLGVHFTRMIHGGVEAGPNAVLALKREGYRLTSVSVRDVLGMATFAGFWRMARRYWRTGAGEFYRSLSKGAFVRALQKLMPEIQAADLEPGGAGVRAQAVDRDGRLVDDFRILQGERMIHVLNAPSPAATASISIGRTIAAMARKSFGLAAAKAQPA